MVNQPQPEFTRALLHPKHWGVWFGFGFLALLVNLLPHSALIRLGRYLGKLSCHVAKRRVHIARVNVKLAFPEKSAQEVERFVNENIKNSGLALIETGITWFWPSWRFKRLIIEKDITPFKQHAENGKGVLVVSVHQLNLEITGRAYAELGFPGYGVYRPHNNPVYDYIQIWGRTRCGNGVIDRADLKKMIRMLKRGERLWYLPDHDYGRKKSVFVPFFAVKDACTTTGTSIIAKTSRCALVPGSAFRNPNGQYEVIAKESIEDNFPYKDDVAAATYINHYLEQVIMRAPEQWMWMHRRFKTHPEKALKNSRYKNI